MRLYNDDSLKFSVVVFPFLKTTQEIKIGGFTFRSTDSIEELPPEQARCITEIANTLFLQDNFRIKSASYAIIPCVDVDDLPDEIHTHLRNIQSVVAYHYCYPRHEFGDIFLSSEHASLVIFTPCRFPQYLINRDFHTNLVGDDTSIFANKNNEIDGYAGLYNLQHPFWVAKHSRLYGPKPHMIMNQSQNLYADLSYALTKRIDYKLLQKQLNKPNNSVSSRIFTAINWFYKANKDENDNFDAIIKLSIAFEALLNLPKDGKTERFIDTISLLLGRTPRLDNWAKQFYEVRSGIVHEGYTHTDQLRFNVSINKQQRKPYQSLLSYGRQIFQLCVSTLLVGADLAEEAGLEGKFITNQERFEKICELLNQSNTVSQLNNISSLVIAIQQYKYISENELQINTMIGAVKEVAKIVVEQDQDLSNEFKKLLELLINAPNSSDNYEQLEALQKLKDFLPKELFLVYPSYKQIVKDLIEVIWSYVFLHYFWLKKQHNIE